MASAYFNRGKTEILKANIDLDADTIKVAFMATSYTPDIDNDQYYSDISASVVGTPQTLASVAVSKNDTNDAADADATDVSLTNQTLTTDMVVYYKDTGTPATSPLIAYADLSATLAPVDGPLDLTFPARGFLAF